MKKNDTEPADLKPVEVPEKKPLWKDALQTVFMLACTVAFCLLFFRYVGQRVAVDGSSMKETLQNKDQLIIDCFTYHFLHEPERFDIIVFRLKSDPKVYYIKRVIGLPGETVQIRDSVIYINGQPIEDPYSQGVSFRGGSAENPVTLGEGEFFVMGDNRNDSIDSRFSVGPVNKSQIIGRAFFRLLPFKKMGSIAPEKES